MGNIYLRRGDFKSAQICYDKDILKNDGRAFCWKGVAKLI